jgi:hypothetical protein
VLLVRKLGHVSTTRSRTATSVCLSSATIEISQTTGHSSLAKVTGIEKAKTLPIRAAEINRTSDRASRTHLSGRGTWFKPEPRSPARTLGRRRPPAVSSIVKNARARVVRVFDRKGGFRDGIRTCVTFEGVGRDRIEEMRQGMEGDPPEGLPAKEIIVLHDPEAEKSVVIVFFDTEDDYRQGDAVLNAMPAGDTPGSRISVAKYEVPIRMAT